MMQLQVLRLDHNELTSIPNEVGDLQMLSELSFSDNKVQILPLSLSKLKQLKMLNFSDNQIKHLPQELGEMRELRQLYIHGNRFNCLPCSFVNIAGSLEELSLEWFMYAKPPRQKLIKKEHQDGKEIFDQLIVLCNLLQKYKMNECALVTFLENFSSHVFNINSKDNRLRTPLHNAAVKGDNGVLEGLLLGKAETNTLDKDNCTPLCLAIREENFDAAVILINANVDVNLGGGIFGSPMHLAVVKLEVWIVKKLIMNRADVNKTDCDGNTPLHFVMNVFSKNPQKCMSIAELLIMNGAKVNSKNNDNWAPLHLAARKGQEKGIQTIIRLNQTLKEKSMECFDLNLTGGAQQWTAVHLAAHGGFIQIVKDLVAADVDIFTRNHSNQLPRHCAKGNYILTKFLKLAEQHSSRQSYASYHIHNQYELIENVKQKKCKDSTLQKQNSFKKQSITQIADEYAQNYDTFMTNLAQLKVFKAFTQIDVVKKTSQQNITSGVFLQTQQLSQSLTPSQRLNNDPLLSKDFDFSHALMKSQVLNPSDFKLDSKFSKLNMKAEEKKINLFYLKDILIKESSTQQERLDALFKIKRNQFKLVFCAAMRSLLPEFEKIDDAFVQKEIIQAIQVSSQHTLLPQLKDILNSKKIDESVIEEIEDTINILSLVAKRPQSYQVNANIQNGNSNHLNSTGHNNDSFDKSRNVNSFKMKGMGSLISSNNNNKGISDILRSSAGTPSTLSNSFKLQTLIANDNDQNKKIRKGSEVLYQQTAKLLQTQPLRKVLGTQNNGGNVKCSTPYNGVSNHTQSTMMGQTMMLIPPKATQMLKKKHPNSKPASSGIPVSSLMQQKKTVVSSQLSAFTNTFNGGFHASKLQYQVSEQIRKEHLLDDDSCSIVMDPSFEYNSKSDYRQNIMTRSTGQGGGGMRSHSHRNSVSIPAKK